MQKTMQKTMQIKVLSGGKAVRMDAAEPAGSGTHPALVLLHGAGGNVDFWLERIAPVVARLGMAVYAAHYFDRTGTGRASPAMLTDGHHVPLWLEAVRDCVAAVAARPGVDAGRVALAGVSLGAFLALALAAQGLRVKAIVEVSGGLVPPYEALATSGFPPVLVVHGEVDTVVPVGSAHALVATLQRLGVAHRVEILVGEGHWFSGAAQMRIQGAVTRFLQELL